MPPTNSDTRSQFLEPADDLEELFLLENQRVARCDAVDPPLPAVGWGGQSVQPGGVRCCGPDGKISVGRRGGLDDVLDEQPAGAQPACVPQLWERRRGQKSLPDAD